MALAATPLGWEARAGWCDRLSPGRRADGVLAYLVALAVIGFAVQERCPYCRKELGTLALPPGVTVLHHIRCSSRRCRNRPGLVFAIRDGRARALTDRERTAIVEAATTAP